MADASRQDRAEMKDVDLKSNVAAKQLEAKTAGENMVGACITSKLSGGAIERIVVDLTLLGVIVIVFVIVDSLTTGYVRSSFEACLEWIESNPTAGVFAFMGVYFVATLTFLPGSILALGSGFVFANAFGLGFGVILATVAVFFGASAGAIVALLGGRYLLRDWVQTLTKTNPVVEAIDKALEEKEFRIMACPELHWRRDSSVPPPICTLTLCHFTGNDTVCVPWGCRRVTDR
jgi:hypothetical protein